jgi:hypothetical protein
MIRIRRPRHLALDGLLRLAPPPACTSGGASLDDRKKESENDKTPLSAKLRRDVSQ